MPGSGIVPLKVRAIVGPADEPGQRDNVGCRLTAQEIGEQIRGLQNHRYLFGTNVTFEWDQQVEFLTWADLSPFQPRTQDDAEFEQDVVEVVWSSGFINIYFVGNVQPNTSIPAGGIAFTRDPLQGQQAFGANPYIQINDGGVDRPDGFLPGYTPAHIVGYHVLEHEMAHFLGRFGNMTFGTITYNDDEHAPNNSNTILRGGGVPPASPLWLPGDFDNLATESGQIWTRVLNGTWGSP